MKRIPMFLCALCACAASSCAVETTYIGKAYPVTDTLELYFSWDDVPGPYETMGHITATPTLFSDLEDAQASIEKKARGWQRALDTQIALVAEQTARWQKVRLAVCTYDPALREELVPRLRERIGNAVEILQTGLSADLLVHTGPTLVGMGVIGL